MVVKVKEPIAPEYERIQDGQIIYTYFHLAGVDPMRALFWSAVVNGVAVIVLATSWQAAALDLPADPAGRGQADRLGDRFPGGILEILVAPIVPTILSDKYPAWKRRAEVRADRQRRRYARSELQPHD